MNADEIRQVITSPLVIEFFREKFCTDTRLMSISELSRRVNCDRAKIRLQMDIWEHTKGAMGLSFIRVSNDGDNSHRFTCIKAWNDYVRREELAAAQRGELGYKAARYR